MPEEFRELFDWMDAYGHFMRSVSYPGDKLGMLGSENELEEDYLTAILFRVEKPEQARATGQAWFGDGVPDIDDRLVAFARTGCDGSYAAFWLDDEEYMQIVHLEARPHAEPTTTGFPAPSRHRVLEISACLETQTEPPDQSDINVAFRS